MRSYPFVQTNVFTDERYAFSGNQLATFWNLSVSDLSDEEMLGVAREFNFSETTFVLPNTITNCIRKVRIFTPSHEIPFAGHPTLGTAFVLKNKGIIKEGVNSSNLELEIGPIRVEFSENSHVSMKQPKPIFLEEYTKRETLAQILGISIDEISEKWPIQFVSTGLPFLIIPLVSLSSIRSIKLNVDLLLRSLKDYSSQQLLVFSPETIHPNSHVHVRMFAPSVGVLEDPATGSAAGPLGAYLEVYNVKKGKIPGSDFFIEQGYEIHRPSRLIAKCYHDIHNISAVFVKGQVKMTAEGKFFLKT